MPSIYACGGMLERGGSSFHFYTPLSNKKYKYLTIMKVNETHSTGIDNSIYANPEYLTKVGMRMNDYDGSGINTLGTGFAGMWSKEDQALFEVQMAQAQQMNAWSQMEYENWYNSPEQQARRQRMAGLNPDLQGIDNMSSASPGSVIPPSGPAGTGVGEVASMVGSIFSIFSTAMNIANGIQSFRSGVETVRSQKLDNLNKIDSQAFSYLLDTTRPISDDTGMNLDAMPSLDDILTGADIYAKEIGLSRRDIKSFKESISRQYNSPSFQDAFYKKTSSAAKSRVELAETKSLPYYFDSDESMRIALSEPIKLKFEAMKAAWKQQKSFGEFQADFYSHQSGVIQGQAQNDIVSLQASKARMERMMISARFNMMNSLYKNYKAGNQFSGIMLGLMDFGVNALPTVANMIK